MKHRLALAFAGSHGRFHGGAGKPAQCSFTQLVVPSADIAPDILDHRHYLGAVQDQSNRAKWRTCRICGTHWPKLEAVTS